MKPGFVKIRKISASIIARELLRSPHAIVATINTFVSSFSEIEKHNEIHGDIITKTWSKG